MAAYVPSMMGLPDAEDAWSARAALDFVLDALVHTGAPAWHGSASENAAENRMILLAIAHDVRDRIHHVAVLLEEAEALQIAACQEAGHG